jgi:iron complex transport system permease protein
MIRLLIAIGLTLVAASYLLLNGDYPLSVLDVVRALVIPGAENAFVVRELRAPPVLAAIIAGAGFGVAGLTFQRTLGNNLATPDVLGVSLASSFVAALVISQGVTSTWQVSIGAVFGGVVATVVVLALSARSPRFALTIIINGVAIGYLASAGINWVLASADTNSTRSLYGWLIGTTGFASSSDLPWAIGATTVLMVVLGGLRRPLRALELGHSASASLGFLPLRWTSVALLTAVFLVGVSTALVGPLAFVSLTAPVLARLVIHPSRFAFVSSGVIGAFLVLGADSLHQLVFPSQGLPTGLTTGLVGAPILLWVLWRGRITGGLR